MSFKGNEMTTCVVYIDEAGSPHSHKVPIQSGTTPIFTLAAIAFPLETWRERDRAFLGLKRKYFPDWLEGKKRDEYVEIKGNNIAAPRNKDSGRRHAFNQHLLNFIGNNNGKCFSVSYIKSPDNPVSGTSMYTSALQILVERISQYVAEHGYYENAILVIDSRMKGLQNHDGTVAKSHMSYIFGHQTGRNFINIMEAPMFADSRISSGIQIVDIFAANIYANTYHRYASGIDGAFDYSHMQKYWPTISSLEFKSETEVNGYRQFGYRVIDHNRGTAE